MTDALYIYNFLQRASFQTDGTSSSERTSLVCHHRNNSRRPEPVEVLLRFLWCIRVFEIQAGILRNNTLFVMLSYVEFAKKISGSLRRNESCHSF